MEKASILQHQLEQQKKVTGGRGWWVWLVLTVAVCVGWYTAAGGGRGEGEGAPEQGLTGGEALVQWLCGRLQQTSGEWAG